LSINILCNKIPVRYSLNIFAKNSQIIHCQLRIGSNPSLIPCISKKLK
jgi:hypothetical protein